MSTSKQTPEVCEEKMSPAQEDALRRVIERSKVDENFVSNEVAQKQFAKWLKN